MKILVIFSLIFASFCCLSRADDYENALARLEGLESELMALKKESSDMPQEELDKASQWIEDARGSLSQESVDTLTDLKIERVSYQIAFLRSLAEESMAKKKADEAAELLQGIRYQTEEIKTTNAIVKEEIGKLEQK